MSETVTAKGNPSGLRAATEEKRIRKRRAVEAAITDMQNSGEVITFKTLAEKAAVSREYLYQNFRSIVVTLREITQAQTVQVDDDEVRIRTARRSATIEVGLRSKVSSLEQELAGLRKQHTLLQRRHEKVRGESEEWLRRYKQAVSELLDLKARLRKSE